MYFERMSILIVFCLESVCIENLNRGGKNKKREAEGQGDKEVVEFTVEKSKSALYKD